MTNDGINMMVYLRRLHGPHLVGLQLPHGLSRERGARVGGAGVAAALLYKQTNSFKYVVFCRVM